ncbi:hypothetical protein EKL30_15740 [Candidimonas sp. SYP-B2681]|uniref:hypothetical protein n=1 Tax=Candidimonas sp. SYP-B2681 TaxID=2497686 RepID=UPI000F884FD6|nr:hypothetical protein [Candidimonas sp. SYP-B2681]RTZ41130.1 hypothetical protein EKL30_15740 [Candidimonas sp. SYP-B2681]
MRRLSEWWSCHAGSDSHHAMHTHAVQDGQALVEGMVVMMVLLSLWTGTAWLGRLQDMGLQATHASAYSAFSSSRNPTAKIDHDVKRSYFSGPAHNWADRRGRRILSNELDEIVLQSMRHAALDNKAQPGGPGDDAQSLRRDWRLDDTGILVSQVNVSALATRPTLPKAAFTGMADFDMPYPQLRRHTAILTGAGHASNDLAVQQTVSRSALGWGSSATTSYGHGRSIASVMVSVDAAWNRTEPVFDWLAPWAGYVPESRIAH